MRRYLPLFLTLLLTGCLLLLCSCDGGKAPPAEETTAEQTTVADSVADTAPTTDPDSGETAEETTDDATHDTAEAPTEPAETEPPHVVIVSPGQRRASYRVMYDKGADTAEVDMLTAMLKAYTGSDFQAMDTAKTADKEIILNSDVREETRLMKDELKEGEYAIRMGRDQSGDGALYIAFTTYRSAYAAAEYLLDTYYTSENGLCVPADLDVKGAEKEYDMITSDIQKLRDPCILVEDGVYYAYGTGWHCLKNTSGNLQGPWQDLGVVASVADPAMDGGSHWAPEVHKYNGAYYMFTTYFNPITNHRGCTIMKADSPEGPFAEITGGHITPADWDAIDGTLYVDPEGQPWMVFVHEWTCMPNGIGSFAAAKLSEDFTHFISEPMELFKANEPSWAVSGVTDGCWMYTTAEGELLMVWSNFDAHGYTVAVAKSSNGRLDGEWIHEEKLLYSKYMTGEYDGGHGMIFTDVDGQMYLSFHSPNSVIGDRMERPTFLAIKEEDGKLVWDESEK